MLRVQPTPEQMERAVAALVLLTHFDSAASVDAIDAAERARIERFAREQAEMYRD